MGDLHAFRELIRATFCDDKRDQKLRDENFEDDGECVVLIHVKSCSNDAFWPPPYQIIPG